MVAVSSESMSSGIPLVYSAVIYFHAHSRVAKHLHITAMLSFQTTSLVFLSLLLWEIAIEVNIYVTQLPPKYGPQLYWLILSRRRRLHTINVLFAMTRQMLLH